VKSLRLLCFVLLQPCPSRVKTLHQKMASFSEQKDAQVATTAFSSKEDELGVACAPDSQVAAAALSSKEDELVDVQAKLAAAALSSQEDELVDVQAKIAAAQVVAEWLLRQGVNQVKRSRDEFVDCTATNLLELESLDLYYKQLSGQIPLELGQLKNLKQLRLQHNQLSGQIPPELGRLENLEDLNLGNNELSGEIPPELERLENLTSLSLGNNQLSGQIPPELGQLARLEVLHLQDNQLTGHIPGTFTQLQKLRVLNVGNNRAMEGAVSQALSSKAELELSIDNTGLDAGISLQVAAYPFYVISRYDIMRMNRLKPHEELKDNGMLKVLTSSLESLFHMYSIDGGHPCNSHQLAFMSHRWLAPNEPHPDDPIGEDKNSKLEQIKAFLQEKPEVEFVWMDYISIPQSRVNSVDQGRAIASLPYYVNCCGSFVILTGDEGESRYEVYRGRGWCRLERLCAICPAKGHGLFGFNPFDVCTKVYKSNKTQNNLEEICVEQLAEDPEEMNPLRGNFTCDDDKIKILPCLQLICGYMRNMSSENKFQALGTSLMDSPEVSAIDPGY